MSLNFKQLAVQYREELFTNVIPFWEKYSTDTRYGGYFTCLDREGKVFDTDKFIWLQGRQAWMFASLYNRVEKRPEWLQMAIHGADFLQKYGHDSLGNFYFSLTREGKPLVQPYNIFSDCFATMAFAQLYKATGRDEYAEMAKNTFENILRRSDNPKGIYNKNTGAARSLKGFSLPMILCNLTLEIEHLLSRELVEETINRCIHEVMEVFYDKNSGLILENVNPDGSFSDSFEGRLLNPGHAIEAMWFVMDLASRSDNQKLLQKAVDVCIRTIEYGWDQQYGGIYYFMDIKRYPPQQLEWDQKLWWVHVETLISLLKGYQLTGDQRCIQWFSKIHEYTWAHFPDPGFGEWFGYLNRQGEVLLPLKGGKWKGCFHVPRALLNCYTMLEKI